MPKTLLQANSFLLNQKKHEVVHDFDLSHSNKLIVELQNEPLSQFVRRIKKQVMGLRRVNR